MFDLKTFQVLCQIPAAEDADAILFDSVSNRVFSLNGDAHSSTVIDPAGKLITNIPLGGKPEYGAAAGDGKVYANLTDTSEVVEIDARNGAVTRRWSTTPCRQPVSMAIDVLHHRLISSRCLGTKLIQALLVSEDATGMSVFDFLAVGVDEHLVPLALRVPIGGFVQQGFAGLRGRLDRRHGAAADFLLDRALRGGWNR